MKLLGFLVSTESWCDDMEHLQGFISWLGRNWLQVSVALSFVVQITPIKWNPWSSLVKWVGKLINTPVMDEIQSLKQEMKTEIDSVKADLKESKSEQQENEKDRIRWEILDFANSCRNGRKHTKDEYEHIFRMNDKYEKLLKPGEKNSYFEAEYEYIKHLHAERQEKNDFL